MLQTRLVQASTRCGSYPGPLYKYNKFTKNANYIKLYQIISNYIKKLNNIVRYDAIFAEWVGGIGNCRVNCPGLTHATLLQHKLPVCVCVFVFCSTNFQFVDRTGCSQNCVSPINIFQIIINLSFFCFYLIYIDFFRYIVHN